MNETHFPKDEKSWLELRTECVTSSDVAALFNLSPYVTRFEYWHRKKNKTIEGAQENEFILWGKRLEATIAKGVAEDQGWEIRHMGEFVVNRELRLASSFDYSIEKGPVPNEKGILEVKNVFGPRFKEGWVLEDGTIEAPPYIELQVQNELFISGRKYGYISTLVSGNQLSLLKRERDEEVINRIISETEKFWKSIDDNQPPPPDFREDCDFISRLYTQSNGMVLDARDDKELLGYALEYKEASQMEKNAAEVKAAAKAAMILKIGGSEKVMGKGFTISAKTVKGGPVSYERPDYRGFRLHVK